MTTMMGWHGSGNCNQCGMHLGPGEVHTCGEDDMEGNKAYKVIAGDQHVASDGNCHITSLLLDDHSKIILESNGNLCSEVYEIRFVPVQHTGAMPGIPVPAQQPMKHDPVNHPQHYTSHPSGIECIEIVRHMGFNRGNAIKYTWRAGDKGNAIEDLEKAIWYLKDEVQRLKKLS